MKPSTIPLRVFLTAASELTYNDFRPLKQSFIADRLGLQQQQVSRAMRVLVDESLIETGPREGPIKTYKLNSMHAQLSWTLRPLHS